MNEQQSVAEKVAQEYGFKMEPYMAGFLKGGHSHDCNSQKRKTDYA